MAHSYSMNCQFNFQTAKTFSDATPHSRGAMRPSRAWKIRPEKQRAWGMPGAQCTRSLACKSETSTRASSPKVHRIHPAFPHAMVLTAYFVLSPVIGLVCHRHLRVCTDLTPASRRQDHTTSPSASAPFVNPRCRVHRIPPRVRDDRDTPLCGAGRQRI